MAYPQTASRTTHSRKEKAYIGKRKVQELRTYDIEKFYATLAKTPCGQYVHGVKQKLSEKQKKRLLSSTSIHEVHTLLKTAFSYAVEWDLIHKISLPRDAPKVNIEERTIWDEKTMLAALQTIENPALHLAVHILSLREGEILGLQPSDLDTYAHTQDKPRQHPSPSKTKSRWQQKSPVRRSLKPSG